MDFAQQRAEKIEYYRAQAQQYNFTREYSRAMCFYIRAGLLGDEDSIIEACQKLKSGYGMSYSYEEFFNCMKVGARKGIADAMYELGVCYSSGLGTDKNDVEAMHWFSEGSKAGSKEAKKSLRTYNYDFVTEEYDELNPFALSVRTTVFIDEQGLDDEFDDMDAIAHHFVIFDGSHPVATCRVYWDAVDNTFILGRLAVIKEYRGLYLGADLVTAAVAYVRNQKGKSLALQSPLQTREFYEKNKFEAEGPVLQGQGYPHVWMWRRFA